jgi:rSAM/selenodomain-associated transferase 2
VIAPAAAPVLSIIIPALNEAAALPPLLEQLAQQEGIGFEVIVADGGSSDDTAKLAQNAGAQVVAAARGRGVQMNAGAAAARGEYLLFLHADSALPAPNLLRNALAFMRAERAVGGPRAAGHFPLHFVRSAPGRERFYRHLHEKTLSNRRDTIHGDQGFFLEASYFRELGGFDEPLPFLEDQRLAARIFSTGRWIVLPGHLQTSARRFETQGALRLYTLMSIIMGMHDANVQGFFSRAPKLYAAQSEAGTLRLYPYLRLVQSLIWEARWKGVFAIPYRVGRYVRGHSWQPFFAIDVGLRPLLGPGRYPLLRFHDRFFQPLIDNRFSNAVVAVGVSVWFLALLPLACLLFERRGREPLAGGRP